MIRVVLAGLLVAACPSVLSADSTAPVFDEWWTPGFNARVRLERCAEQLCGTIVWVWDERATDVADKLPLVGRKIIVNMRADGAGSWSGGRIYNPEDGRHYDASLRLVAPNNLTVEGCALFFCKSQTWRRADPAMCPPVVRASSGQNGP